jgi:simple sugar transport system substrate-binding protein
MSAGMVKLSALSPSLPASVRTALAQRERDIVAGRFQPFQGPLSDNTGKPRTPAGPLGDAQIARMDWLVQGVSGNLPAR